MLLETLNRPFVFLETARVFFWSTALNKEIQVLPLARLMRAFRVIESRLWVSMEREPWWCGELNRCIWASSAVQKFLHDLDYQAEITPAILFLAAFEHGNPQPPTMSLGEPGPGEVGLHLVVVVRDKDERRWIVDSSVAQARRDRWPVTLPSVIVAAVEVAKNARSRDPFVAKGYQFAREIRLPGSGTRYMMLRWYLAPGRQNGWQLAPDAESARGLAVALRLKAAWRMPQV
jgi:hypothetical protein